MFHSLCKIHLYMTNSIKRSIILQCLFTAKFIYAWPVIIRGEQYFIDCLSVKLIYAWLMIIRGKKYFIGCLPVKSIYTWIMIIRGVLCFTQPMMIRGEYFVSVQ